MGGRFFLAVYRGWSRVCARIYISLCRGAFFEVGQGTAIELPIRLSGESRISLGRRVYIGSNSWFQVLQNAKLSERAVIVVGDGVSISGYCTLSAVQSIIIERNVLIARYVYIADHSHAFEDSQQPIKDQGIAKVAPVRICEGAWLGQSVVVCAGVTIGRNSVIGANSVVRHNIPDFCIAAGAPAKVIRQIGQTDKGRSV